MVNERALLVGVRFLNEKLEDVLESLQELKELSETAGAVVIENMLQQRRSPDPKYFIGKGKVDEIKIEYVNRQKIELIIINHELAPTQIRNLEKELEIKVISRTDLILDIFALHARSNTSKLQVELAQLVNQLPRIAGGKGVEMSRLGGGIGTRGPGEKQLEIDRRWIQNRIHLIKEKLVHIEKERVTQRKSRVESLFKIAIVGYTNSGKSTLLNRLTKADVLVEDKLFATLDTTTRKLWLGNENISLRAVITDTVGFIRDLPHGLVESFKSTMEDTLTADLLLLVVDISSPHYPHQIKVVEETLAEMGGDKIPAILCFNKIDLVSEKALLESRLANPEASYISAKANTNIQYLKERLKKALENFQSHP